MEEDFLRRGLSTNTACVSNLKNLVLSVWSVVFVGTTEYTEYTEREGAAAGVLCLCSQLSGICANLRNLRFPPLPGHPSVVPFLFCFFLGVLGGSFQDKKLKGGLK